MKPGAQPLARSLKVKLGILFAFAIASIDSWRIIPLMRPWGADLANLYYFQRCAKGHSPYQLTAEHCGDPWGRPMIYPPLMYRSFAWLRYVKLENAPYIWAFILVTGMCGVLWAWAKLHQRGRLRADSEPLFVFGIALMLQFPFVFALERGSSDIVAIVLWTLGAWLFDRKKILLAGLVAGVAASLRLYPVFPCVIVGVGMLIASFRTGAFKKLDFVKFGGGATATFVATNAIWADAPYYYEHVLPTFAKHASPGAEWSHSISGFLVAGEFPIFSAAIGLLLVAVWIYAAQGALARRGMLVWAGALAMSTFNQGTSCDYNLTTVYPLFMLLFIEMLDTGRYELLFFGMFAVCGDRGLFVDKDAKLFTIQMHTCLELAFVTLVALWLGRIERDDGPVDECRTAVPPPR